MTSALLASTAFGAHAATITLDTSDFTFSGGVLQGGNCPVAGPCLQIAGNNSPDGIAMTYSGGTFTITSFLYTMQGNSGISASGLVGGVVAGLYEDSQNGGNSGALTADLVAGSPGTVTGSFTDIDTVLFENIGTGAIRIEGFAGTAPMAMAPVPLPAAGMLLLTALGGFAAFGRRKA